MCDAWSKEEGTFCIVSSFPNSDWQTKKTQVRTRSFNCGLWICFRVSMDGWFFLFWGHYCFLVCLTLCIFVSLLLCWAFSSCRGWRHSSLWCTGFSLKWLLLLRSTGCRCMGLAVAANTLSCSAAYRILVPGPGRDRTRVVCIGKQILNHWTPYPHLSHFVSWELDLETVRLGSPKIWPNKNVGCTPFAAHWGPISSCQFSGEFSFFLLVILWHSSGYWADSILRALFGDASCIHSVARYWQKYSLFWSKSDKIFGRNCFKELYGQVFTRLKADTQESDWNISLGFLP